MARVDSKFTLVTLAAMRAREINDYYNQLGEGLGKIVPPAGHVGVAQAAVDLARGDRGGQDPTPSPSLPNEAPRPEAEAALLTDAEEPDQAVVGRRRRPMAAPMTASTPDPLVALRGRRVVLGVTGGIAAYKAVDVCRRLVDAGAHVVPVLTDDAQRFVGALTFSALASEPARTSLFEGPDPIPHTQPRPAAPTWSSWRPPPRRSSASTRTASPTISSPPRCSRRGRPCCSRRRCTPRCGSTPRSRRTSPCCASAACTWSIPRRGASPAATPARAGSPIPSASWPQPPTCSRRPATSRGCACWSRRAARASRSTRCASSATGRRGRWATRSPRRAARRGAAVTLVTTIGRPADDSGIDGRAGGDGRRDGARPCSSRSADADVVVMAAAVADFRPEGGRRREAQEARRRARGRARAHTRHPRRAG